MPDMKRMSASVYGYFKLSARARSFAAESPIIPMGYGALGCGLRCEQAATATDAKMAALTARPGYLTPERCRLDRRQSKAVCEDRTTRAIAAVADSRVVKAC